ncbi:acyltransferase [Desulfonatronum lacustre]|uniref:acyltransferase n=1 Tax=Desulfonatronum lacustre TaxID=66849 RepID=UPI0004B3D95F|nr:DapH/DapD/GlmU-related protein [Desulfonatronum lacustre]SMP38339.1 Acetyltransferase (isoleucine patch superfamily) [Desulfonatronum zhilinae]
MTNPTPQTPPVRPTLAAQLNDASSSPLRCYARKVLGDAGPLSLAYYELVNLLFCNMPSSLGFFLRRTFYRRLFRSVGRGLIIGRGVSIRHPGKITLGHRVAVDDNALLDASGLDSEGIFIGDEVIVSRNCMVQAKIGSTTIGSRTEIGANTIISSISRVEMGKFGLIGPHCLIGGGNYKTDRTDIPMMDLGWASRGPVKVGDDVWMGAGVVIPDGVRVGTGCVIGAGAVVSKDLPDYAVAMGVPARIVRYRPKPGHQE